MPDLSKALDRNFTSPNVCDTNLENANVVDVLNYLQESTSDIAKAITSREQMKTIVGPDCLTQGAQGIAQSLDNVANAITLLADKIEMIANAIERR